MRRPIQPIVCALIAAVAIAAGLPGEAGARGRSQAPRSRTAHTRSQAPRPCLNCQLRALKLAAESSRERPAVTREPAAPVERTAPPVAAAVAGKPRAKPGKHRKPSFLLRAKVATLHLAEALHLYHPQPDQGSERPRLTEERVWFEVVGSLLGIDVGVTVSEITRVRGARGSLELIHVVSADGAGQNYESVVHRMPLAHGQRIEVQGPALNTTAGLPLGFRAVGLGLTSDLFEPGQNRAVSYTAEIKLTERALLYWAPVWAPGAAAAVDGALGAAGNHTFSSLVAGALPVVSAALAVQSAARAIRTFRNPRATRLDKALAAGHAVADGVRVAFPLAGTLANVALIGVTAGVSYLKVKRARAQAQDPVDPRFLRLCAPGGCTR